MEESISIKTNEVLIKFLNCLERILFIDNRWMKDYADLKKGIDREYKGLALYFKKILNSLDKNGASILAKNLPNKLDIQQYNGEIKAIILESFNNSFYLNEREEDKQYVAVACPELERIFHFKINSVLEAKTLQNAEIKDFFFHPLLPRIKIYTRNFKTFKPFSELNQLEFIYTLVGDADIQANSYRSFNGEVCWNELVSDPAYGVQVGNLGVYFISPLKIIEIKRDIENLHQIILVIEEFNGKRFEVCMKTNYYRDIFKEFPEEKVLENPRYIRALLFQGFGENFRHLIKAESINYSEFEKDSFFSHIRFRRVVQKKVLKEQIPEDLYAKIEEKSDFLFYFPKGFSTLIFDAVKDFNSPKRMSASFIQIRKYHEFKKICRFHPEWEEIYKNKLSSEEFYSPLKIINPNPWGIHHSFINQPAQKMAFYARNRRLLVLCTDCFKYNKLIKTKDLPNECPICNSKTFVALENKDHERLIKENLKLKRVDKKVEEYLRMSTLSISFSKFIFYILNVTNYSLNTCVKILNELKEDFNDEDLFFKKLYKITHDYNRKEDIHALIYKLKKDEI